MNYTIEEWEGLPWWKQESYLVGMNQYFEWQVTLAGGKHKSTGGGHSGYVGSPPTDMDISSLVPVERV